MWTYKCYVTNDSPNLWAKWYEQNPSEQGRHDAVFEALEQIAPWREPYAKALKGSHLAGIIEVRLRGTRQWRIFGFYGEQRQEFILVAIGYHKGSVYSPKDALETAKRRMEEIRRDGSNAKECNRPQ